MAFLLRQSVFVIIQRLDYNQGNIAYIQFDICHISGAALCTFFFAFVIDVLRIIIIIIYLFFGAPSGQL